jgi:HK97 family phage major capsid protein
MRIKVILREDWKPKGSDEAYSKGEILDLDKDEALELIGNDIADRYREPEKDPAKGADDPNAWKAMVTETVKAAVEDATKATREGNKVKPGAEDGPVVKHVKDRITDDPKLGYKDAGGFYRDVIRVGDAKRGHLDKAENPEGLKAVSGMSEGVDSDGGFLVPAEFRATLLERTYTTGQVASRCFQLPMSTNAIEIPYVDETSRASGSRGGSLQVYRKAEAAQYSTEKAAFGLLALKAKKLTAMAHLTEELIQDNVIAVEAIMTRLLSQELAYEIDDELINGIGGMQMTGILNTPCVVQVTKETGQAATTIVYANVTKMWSRLWSGSRGNSVWFIAQDALPQLYALTIDVGTGGAPAYLPANGLSGSPYGTLFGRPVIELEQCQTLGTVGDIYLADMSQYVYATKGGIKAATSVHLRFDYDEVALKLTMRNDGAAWWRSALTPANGSSTVSPFIKLATRS